MEITEPTPRPGAPSHDAERTRRRPEDRRRAWSSVRRLFIRFGIGTAGLIVSSATASAHGGGHSGTAAAFAVVLGLPILAGLAGGAAAAIRYRTPRRMALTDQDPSIVIALLLVGLGVASLLPAVIGHLWLAVAGGTIGAAIALWFVGGRAGSGDSCGNHAELTLGAISTHRLFEGIVVGTLYSAGAAVGLLGAVVLAGHTALETAAVGGLYATSSHRTRTAGAIVLVQAGYLVGAIFGLGVTDAVPVSIRTIALAVVGGALLIVGVGETERSFIRDR